jgi:hypothetical protein
MSAAGTNPAASVDAPMTLPSIMSHRWRRTTEQHRLDGVTRVMKSYG